MQHAMSNELSRRMLITNGLAAAAAATVASSAARGETMAANFTGSVPQQAPAKFQLKYAPHFGMFSAHAKDEIDQLKFMADQGFTAFEDNGMRGRSKEMQEKIGATLQKLNMTMGVFVANDGGFEPLLPTGRREHLDRFVANIKESVEVARRVNARWMTVVPGVVDQSLPEGVQTANVIDALKRGAEIFEKHNLVMVCEPLNWRDHPGLFLKTVSQMHAIAKGVGSPACKILYDIYHQQIAEGNIIPTIELCASEIAYFQIGDNPGRNEPGTGELNYRNIFKHIKERGFEGVLGMEHGNSRGGKEGELAVIAAYREADRF